MITALDYLLYALPALSVTVWARFQIWRAYREGSRMPVSSGRSGAEAAALLMNATGIGQIEIEPVLGELCDHYDAAHKVLRLSPRVYGHRSLFAVGIAAHEVGHAIQDASGYRALAIRSLIVPLASIGSTICWVPVAAGLLIGLSKFVFLGIILFSFMVILQIINLPVEFDASRRARDKLQSTGVINPEEGEIVAKVLNAAAWAYVAVTLTGVLSLFYYSMEPMIGPFKQARSWAGK